MTMAEKTEDGVLDAVMPLSITQEIAEFLVTLTPGMETWTTVHTVAMPLWEHLATMTMEKSESVHC